MSYEVKGIVLKAINDLLNGLVVDTISVAYYADSVGKKSEGIYLESYAQDDEGTKHAFANMIRITLNTYSETLPRTTAITREVMKALKASVSSTLQLSDGWVANYTLIPSVNSFVEQEGAQTRHRDAIRLQLRVGQSDN